MAMTLGSYTSYNPPRDITAETRRLVDRLNEEMASGRPTDLGRSVSSDFSEVSRLAHELETSSARDSGLAQARTWTSAAQATLSSIEQSTSRLANQLGATLTSEGLTDTTAIGLSGRAVIEDAVNGLNMMIDGRAVFGNGATTPPLADVEILLADIDAIAAASPDLATYEAGLDTYFGAGGGFETSILNVAKTTSASFPDGDGGVIEIELSAADPKIRDTFRQAAFFAGLPAAGFSSHEIVTSQRSNEIIAETHGAISKLIDKQAGLGVIEEQIEVKRTRLEESELDIELELGRLTKLDDYETATYLQNEFTRLENLYTITARRAGLNLTSFLR